MIFTSLAVVPRVEAFRKGLIACVLELLNRQSVATVGERIRFIGLSALVRSVTIMTELFWPLILCKEYNI